MELGVVCETNSENLTVGDLKLTNADYVVLSNTREETRQRIVVQLNFFRAEWFLNLDSGTPWFSVLGEKGAEDDLRVLVSQVVLGTEGVAALESITVTETSPRAYAVNFTVKVIGGTVLTFSSFVVGR
jgi:hypothetical protein